jgi:hydrogenase-4 component B
MEAYGGLIRYLPQTAFFFLIGSMAISALPPFNGFFSEWLTFQSLFQGISVLSGGAKWIFILAAGSLAFTGGLALACFVKAFGLTFLARPRTPQVSCVKESAFSMRFSLGLLAGLTLLLGLLSGPIIELLKKVANQLTVVQTETVVLIGSWSNGLSVGSGFAAVSPLVFVIVIIGVIAVVGLVVALVINRRQKVIIGSTWDCGTDLTPRMEISAAGFSRSMALIFKGILKPSLQYDLEYHDSQSRYLSKSRKIILGAEDIYQTYFYQPLRRLTNELSKRTKNIQSGNVNLYILYLFAALLIALFVVL